MKTFIITPHDGSPPYEVQAKTYDFSEQTGRHIFKGDDEDDNVIVANLLNVGVRRKPTA